jgi:hypothetical protein
MNHTVLPPLPDGRITIVDRNSNFVAATYSPVTAQEIAALPLLISTLQKIARDCENADGASLDADPLVFAHMREAHAALAAAAPEPSAATDGEQADPAPSPAENPKPFAP